MSDTTTAPTSLDVERCIQLYALWIIATGDSLGDQFSEWLPDVKLDDVKIGLGDRDFEDLFRLVLPGEDEDTPRGFLFHGRVDLLIAQLLRAIDLEHVKNEAGRFEAMAAEHFKRAALDEAFDA